jgi:ATP/maltotriose-dependent transcriptional regulator MalT/DNA-binding SARP family transcriptional activator
MTWNKHLSASTSNLAKLSAPGMKHAYARTHLFELIDRARWDNRFIWLGAEAGSGKTTLAVSYLQASSLKTLWYQIDEGDADIASVFYYLDHAARNLEPEHRGLPMLTPEYLGAVEVYARNFFRELFSLFHGTSGILIFDNYQDLPEDALLHQLLVLACDELPLELTILVLSREKPHTAFARLFANARATTIDASALRLTLEETADLSTLYMGKKIGKEEASLLHRKTGGWAAGLRLMLNQSQEKQFDLLIEDRRPPEVIFDYFANEVFQHVDESTQDFLLRSALLPTMTIEAVGELTGNPRAAGIIKELVRQNYFIVYHDGNDPAYQYHDLFRHFLLIKCSERFISDEHRKLVQDAAAILNRTGQYEHAAQLFVENGDHNSLQTLIEQHAPELAAQGRIVTLERWLQALPVGHVQSHPWLGYWFGYCRIPFDLLEARHLFECAYAQFKEQEHHLGQYLAWSGIADTFRFSWDDFSGIDPWVDELQNLQNICKLESYPEAAPRVICSALGMLSFVRSDLPEVQRLLTQAESLLPKVRGSSLHIVVAATLQFHYGWVGDLTKMREITRELEQFIDNPNLEPLARLYGCLALAEIGWLTDDFARARKWGVSGLEYGERHGIVMFKPLFQSQILYSCQLEDDMEGAKEQLEQFFLCTRPERRLDVAHYHYHVAWLALEQGELGRAREHTERSLDLTKMLQALIPIALNQIMLAEVLVVSGEYHAVPQLLEQADTFAKRMGSNIFMFMARLIYAFMFLRAGREDECAAKLTAALEIGRDQGYTAYSGRHNRHLAELCLFALNHNIETDYVRFLIRKIGLLPPQGELTPESWPWPVRILTLGSFEVLRYDELLQFTTKVQKKPLELLKALIALGGSDVSTMKLGELLWPDAEGDALQQNMKATLHRLRKLIGQEAVDVQDNRVGLNSDYCWTDVDALNRYLDRIPEDPTDMNQDLEQLAAHMLGLYRGHFLSEQEANWVIVPREVLRGSFLKAMKQVVGGLCQHGKPQVALDYYYKLLDLEPLREELYVAIMRCYVSIGQLSEAAGVYQQLCTLLDSQLGLEPSAEIQELHQSIVSQQA